jgi:hypothetical protein
VLPYCVAMPEIAPVSHSKGWTALSGGSWKEARVIFELELGLKVLGEGPVEGGWVDRVVGLEDVRVDIAMLETSDGHGRLELMKFHAPPARGSDGHAPRTP